MMPIFHIVFLILCTASLVQAAGNKDHAGSIPLTQLPTPIVEARRLLPTEVDHKQQATGHGEVDQKLSLAAQILQYKSQDESYDMAVDKFVNEAIKNGRNFKLSDFDLPPFPEFSDKRFAAVAPSLIERHRQIILSRWDSYELYQYVTEEVLIKKRPAHEVSDLFLKSQESLILPGSPTIENLVYICRTFMMYDSWCTHKNKSNALEIVLDDMIKTTSSYFKTRGQVIGTGQMLFYTFPDVRHNNWPFNQFLAEQVNERFETNMLMIRDIFMKGEISREKLSERGKKFLTDYPTLQDFLEGRTLKLLDMDSYIETLDPYVAAMHAARRGEGVPALLNILKPKGDVLFMPSEAKSRQEKRRQKRAENKMSKKVSQLPNAIPEIYETASAMVKLQQEKLKNLDLSRQIHRQLKRDEIEKMRQEKMRLELEAQKRALENVLEAPLPKAEFDPAINFMMLDWDDELPAPKIKVKTRKNTQQSEIDQKGLTQAHVVSSEVHPIFECDPFTFYLHRELMGSYNPKFSWKKLERLAKGLDLIITIPGHGGSHRGLKYTDAAGKVHAFSVPARSAYGKRFFSLLQEYFRDTCHLDEAHVVLEK